MIDFFKNLYGYLFVKDYKDFRSFYPKEVYEYKYIYVYRATFSKIKKYTVVIIPYKNVVGKYGPFPVFNGKLIEWIETNIKDDCIYIGPMIPITHFYFKNEEEAMVFKLIWG